METYGATLEFYLKRSYEIAARLTDFYKAGDDLITLPNRFGGFAAVFAVAVIAGTIDSSSGSAIVAPMPRRNVRRGKACFEMNITPTP